MLSVTETASLLGVSRQRVLQLIHAGKIDADMLGKTWAVDEESARAWQQRFAKGTTAARSVEKRSYTLMNAEYEVLEIEYDHANQRFSASHKIFDAQRAPVGVVSARGAFASAERLYEWWRHRAVPAQRSGLGQRLAELGITLPEELAFASLGLSLSDQYWLRPQGAQDLRWADINFFDNQFEEVPGGWVSSLGGTRTPDNTSEGVFPKKWVCRGAKRILLKSGGGAQQPPYNEHIASKLHGKLLKKGEFVSYKVEAHGAEAVSACENFLTKREEYIPAWYYRPRGKKADGRSAYAAFAETCEDMGIEDVRTSLSKMIICDHILANEDRHWRNFGIVRNIDTLECRIAPLFDTGSSLWYGKTLPSLRAGNFSFASKPFNANSTKQLLMADETEWLDLGKLEGFAEDAEAVFSQSEELAPRAALVAQGIRQGIQEVERRLL